MKVCSGYLHVFWAYKHYDKAIEEYGEKELDTGVIYIRGRKEHIIICQQSKIIETPRGYFLQTQDGKFYIGTKDVSIEFEKDLPSNQENIG